MNKWVALAVCALAGTMLSGGAESLSFLPTDTEIAFKLEDQIYIMNADGSDQRMLASNNVAGDLAWSPDGRTLAFTRSTSGGPGFDLWQVAPETGKQQRLASQGLSNLDPTWSPDGRRVAFAHLTDLFNAHWSVYTVNRAGKDRRRVTPPSRFADDNPDWSPDGKTIAFQRYDYDAHEVVGIFLIDVTRRKPRQLRGAEGGSLEDWSPDGRRVLFRRDDALWRVDSTGFGSARRITNPGAADDGFASWSPDGRRIVYVHFTQGRDRSDVFVMNANGGNRRNLTHSAADKNLAPSWSPDSRWVAYVSRREGNSEVYAVDVDGGAPQRLTSNTEDDRWPVWRPKVP